MHHPRLGDASCSNGSNPKAGTLAREQILDAAIREIHADRFVTNIDAALFIQPILVGINALLDRPAPERFFPIKFEDVVQRRQIFQDKGFAGLLVQMSANNPVLAALVTAASQEGYPIGTQLKPKTDFLLSCLNAHSKTALEPMPER